MSVDPLGKILGLGAAHKGYKNASNSQTRSIKVQQTQGRWLLEKMLKHSFFVKECPIFLG